MSFDFSARRAAVPVTIDHVSGCAHVDSAAALALSTCRRLRKALFIMYDRQFSSGWARIGQVTQFESTILPPLQSTIYALQSNVYLPIYATSAQHLHSIVFSGYTINSDCTDV